MILLVLFAYFAVITFVALVYLLVVAVITDTLYGYPSKTCIDYVADDMGLTPLRVKAYGYILHNLKIEKIRVTSLSIRLNVWVRAVYALTVRPAMLLFYPVIIWAVWIVDILISPIVVLRWIDQGGTGGPDKPSIFRILIIKPLRSFIRKIKRDDYK